MMRKKDGFGVRVRCGSVGQLRVTLRVATEAEAARRHKALAAMAERLVKRGCARHAEYLVRRAEQCSDRALFEACIRAADKVKAGDGAAVAGPLTFGQLGELWTSGKLHARFPDHVRAKSAKGHSDDRVRLVEMCKAVGNVPVASFALADAHRAMAAIPARAKSSTTRRHYAQILAKLMAYAVFPLELREHSPLPKGFLPKVAPRPAMSFLYPDEDRQLLAASAVPLAYRVYYGLLAREGFRPGEALALDWSDIDAERGVVYLDENKTSRPRGWALADGTLAGLRLLSSERRPFASMAGADAGSAADLFREHLKQAGVSRAQLFQQSARRQAIRVHDLRGTFVTLSLAAGKTEGWITARTGHTSSQMLNQYRRAAQTAAEVGQGELDPLILAVSGDSAPAGASGLFAMGETESETELSHPMLLGQNLSMNTGGSTRTRTEGPRIKKLSTSAASCKNPAKTGGNGARKDDSEQTVSALSHPDELLLQTLSEATHAAVDAGQWALVGVLGEQFDAAKKRLQARQAPPVQLATKRDKRELAKARR